MGIDSGQIFRSSALCLPSEIHPGNPTEQHEMKK